MALCHSYRQIAEIREGFDHRRLLRKSESRANYEQQVPLDCARGRLSARTNVLGRDDNLKDVRTKAPLAVGSQREFTRQALFPANTTPRCRNTSGIRTDVAANA